MDTTTPGLAPAAKAYAAAKAALGETGQRAETPDIGAAIADFAAELKRGEQTAEAGLTGQADPQSVVEALISTELAVETAVAVRDKVVEAYQEILRMPV